MRLGEEDIELCITMDWVRFNGFDSFIWHTANERACSAHSGSILKRKGVRSGVADLTIMRPSGNYHGAFVELKSALGKLSPNQKKFLDDMNAEGYFTAVCYSSNSAIQTIKDYLKLE